MESNGKSVDLDGQRVAYQSLGHDSSTNALIRRYRRLRGPGA